MNNAHRMVQKVPSLIKLDAILSCLLRAGKVRHQPQLIPQQHAGDFWPNILKKSDFSGEDKNMTSALPKPTECIYLDW